MSDGLPPPQPTPLGQPQGRSATLRELREAQGIALDVLAAQIKVSPAKLEALESGRYDNLPDAAFTRALAMAVCRVLKVDPAPVLATLPSAQPVNLSATEPGQVPFKPTRARLNLDVPSALPWRELWSARWLVPAGVLLAAALVYKLPSDMKLTDWLGPGLAAASGAGPEADAEEGTPLAASAVAPVDAVSAEVVQAASAALAASEAAMPESTSPASSSPVGLAESAASTPRSGSALVLVSTDSSWVEIRDANGDKLLSRHVTPGETIGVDGVAPMKVKIGNAGGIQLTYQGNPIELAAFTRNNVARLELK